MDIFAHPVILRRKRRGIEPEGIKGLLLGISDLCGKDRGGFYYWLAAMYLCSSLGAYQLGPFPVQWLGSVLAVALFAALLLSGGRFETNIYYPVWMIQFVLLFSVLGAVFSASMPDFESLLPVWSTTNYFGFIFLRYFQFLVFVSVYLASVEFLKRYGLDSLIKLIVLTGALISVFSVYVYVAQINGLPEITRGRIGTGGGEQAVSFSYAFHRAMGPFREPSHLAEWLVLPIFMTFLGKSPWSMWLRVLMLGVLLLTGSLTGMAAVLIGYLVSSFVVFPIGKALGKIFVLWGVILISLVLFLVVAVPNVGGSTDLWTVIGERVRPILEGGGLLASNRGYVYEYVSANPFPWLGYGLGNGNILFGFYQGAGLMGAFLSLYVNMLYAVGYLGFIFVVILLGMPVLALIRCRADNPEQVQALLAAYIGWLVVFLVHSEELSVSFAVCYALCLYYYVGRRQGTRVELRRPDHAPATRPVVGSAL